MFKVAKYITNGVKKIAAKNSGKKIHKIQRNAGKGNAVRHLFSPTRTSEISALPISDLGKNQIPDPDSQKTNYRYQTPKRNRPPLLDPQKKIDHHNKDHIKLIGCKIS